MGRVLWLVLLVGWSPLVLSRPSVCLAAFEANPIGPQERGSATSLAAGLAGAPPDTFRMGALRLYAFRPFGVPEIDFAALALEVPICADIDRLVVSYQRLGAFSYTEEICLVSARLVVSGSSVRRASLEPAVRLGLVRDGETFRDHAWLLDLSAEVWPAAALRARARLKNLLGSGLAGEGSPCPRAVAVGVGLGASDKLGFGLEIGKDAGFPVCMASGVEFQAAKGLVLRAGVKTHPREFACGVGFRRGPVAVDAASSINLDLGATHEAGVTLFWR